MAGPARFDIILQTLDVVRSSRGTTSPLTWRRSGPVVLLALSCVSACALRPPPLPDGSSDAPAEARQVEVIRTSSGVPHIYADNMRALGYALGYLQLEDYGDRVPVGLLRARGELAPHEGASALDADFANRPYYLRAIETYRLIDAATRDVYEGFAVGVNQYIRRHPGEFPPWLAPDFTGYDVAAAYVYRPSQRVIRRWIARLSGSSPAPREETTSIEEGSSAWALAPGRTASGGAILLRNPHLSWSAGYWEAHVVVPGQLDFYGDFRIGGPLGIVGGFNSHLGFATTNNDVETTEVYALEADPARAGHYRFDGASLPIRRELITLPYRDGEGIAFETRERLTTHLGPVLHRSDAHVYVLRAAEDGEYRGGDQFLRMMRATSLETWKAAMRLRAHPGSHLVYADAAGNILYVWNAAIPVRPHAPGGDDPVPAARTEQVWTALHPFDALPQLLNPTGGYVRNENDGPWLTNLHQRLDPADFPPYFEAADELSLRSQHSLLLLHHDRRLSLEEVVALKHSDRMLLADRVKDELIAAVRSVLRTDPLTEATEDDIGDALALLDRWDNRAAVGSRGAVLFAEWWRLYTDALGEQEPFAEPWRSSEPLATPRGLADPMEAAAQFVVAIGETRQKFGAFDVEWGDVHRVRRGTVDEPASGCAGALGCFRVLNFVDAGEGVRVAAGGDGWVLAVEFTSPPRAYSILAYGQSSKPDSPHYDDQAARFARGEMKPVFYTRADVLRHAIRRYRPGM